MRTVTCRSVSFHRFFQFVLSSGCTFVCGLMSTPASALDVGSTVTGATQCAVDVALICTSGGTGAVVSATVKVGAAVLDVSGALQCAYDRGVGRPTDEGDPSNPSISSTLSNEVMQSCLGNLPIPLLACVTLGRDLIVALIEASATCSAPPIPMCERECQACCKEKSRANIFARTGDFKAYSVCMYRCNCPAGHNVPPGYYLPWGGRMTQPCNGQYRTFSLADG